MREQLFCCVVFDIRDIGSHSPTIIESGIIGKGILLFAVFTVNVVGSKQISMVHFR